MSIESGKPFPRHEYKLAYSIKKGNRWEKVPIEKGTQLHQKLSRAVHTIEVQGASAHAFTDLRRAHEGDTFLLRGKKIQRLGEKEDLVRQKGVVKSRGLQNVVAGVTGAIRKIAGARDVRIEVEIIERKNPEEVFEGRRELTENLKLLKQINTVLPERMEAKNIPKEEQERFQAALDKLIEAEEGLLVRVDLEQINHAFTDARDADGLDLYSTLMKEKYSDYLVTLAEVWEDLKVLEASMGILLPINGEEHLELFKEVQSVCMQNQIEKVEKTLSENLEELKEIQSELPEDQRQAQAPLTQLIQAEEVFLQGLTRATDAEKIDWMAHNYPKHLAQLAKLKSDLQLNAHERFFREVQSLQKAQEIIATSSKQLEEAVSGAKPAFLHALEEATIWQRGAVEEFRAFNEVITKNRPFFHKMLRERGVSETDIAFLFSYYAQAVKENAVMAKALDQVYIQALIRHRDIKEACAQEPEENRKFLSGFPQFNIPLEQVRGLDQKSLSLLQARGALTVKEALELETTEETRGVLEALTVRVYEQDLYEQMMNDYSAVLRTHFESYFQAMKPGIMAKELLSLIDRKPEEPLSEAVRQFLFSQTQTSLPAALTSLDSRLVKFVQFPLKFPLLLKEALKSPLGLEPREEWTETEKAMSELILQFNREEMTRYQGLTQPIKIDFKDDLKELGWTKKEVEALNSLNEKQAETFAPLYRAKLACERDPHNRTLRAVYKQLMVKSRNPLMEVRRKFAKSIGEERLLELYQTVNEQDTAPPTLIRTCLERDQIINQELETLNLRMNWETHAVASRLLEASFKEDPDWKLALQLQSITERDLKAFDAFYTQFQTAIEPIYLARRELELDPDNHALQKGYHAVLAKQLPKINRITARFQERLGEKWVASLRTALRTFSEVNKNFQKEVDHIPNFQETLNAHDVFLEKAYQDRDRTMSWEKDFVKNRWLNLKLPKLGPTITWSSFRRKFVSDRDLQRLNAYVNILSEIMAPLQILQRAMELHPDSQTTQSEFAQLYQKRAVQLKKLAQDKKAKEIAKKLDEAIVYYQKGLKLHRKELQKLLAKPFPEADLKKKDPTYVKNFKSIWLADKQKARKQIAQIEAFLEQSDRTNPHKIIQKRERELAQMVTESQLLVSGRRSLRLSREVR